MKLKQTPADFVVDERSSIVASAGPFALYRLSKRGMTTPDALRAICHRWRLRNRDVSLGGLKDRHAQTTQHFSVFRGPQRRLSMTGLEIEYLGQIPRAFRSQDIVGNRFQIVLRDLLAGEVESCIEHVKFVREFGLPNYFDDQRFGSLVGIDFPARLMVLGQYEAALRFVLTAPYEFDKSQQKSEKALLRHKWGQWKQCRDAVKSQSLRRLLDLLIRQPTDFRGAVGRLHPELQGLHLAAYQSHIWNRMVDSWLRGHGSIAEIELRTGRVACPNSITQEQLTEFSETIFPLPSARIQLKHDAVWAPLLDAALSDEGFSLREMKLPGLRRPFFSKGARRVWLRPNAIHSEMSPDERHTGRFKFRMEFELPRGSYGSLVVKRVAQVEQPLGGTY